MIDFPLVFQHGKNNQADKAADGFAVEREQETLALHGGEIEMADEDKEEHVESGAVPCNKHNA